ncbi:response regulator transcription factor [Pedobacter sp. AW31-3R]|uniref:response regulator transcription factor n=1 Tax=Pedobacter sp. AW31-3R TaxID=3445781 RepID=UPI003FA18EC8
MKKYIHLIEDNEDIRYIVEYFLADYEYQVTVSANVKEFLRDAAGPVPDLYLVDVMLPDGNGLEICRQLKSDERTQHIPVMIMSAHSNEHHVRKESCANDFINKPFDLNHLMLRIERLLM